MPSERFINLSEGKKHLIYDAAMEEFIRVSYEKASINKIIQRAGISRGSFYTYFTDKKDLLGYIISEEAERLRVFWLDCAKKNQGNLWKTSEAFMDYSIDHSKERMPRLVHNILDIEKLYGEIHYLRNCNDHQLTLLIETLYQAVDKTEFKDQGIETFSKILSMILVSQAECISWYYYHLEDKEKVKELFREKLEILQYGICK
ncbi:TetR/AcrR family transcriptional regulator [Clostridium sp. E02]|uniref:TetR/AcrR family transcriptional regulator n=1 Tax=Clostridium sp. E02 TaxID=2487134 RepID=UPI000F52EA3C|nr:TetR/AcrR family transcriptional regulator [Clostridium sp. E02]